MSPFGKSNNASNKYVNRESRNTKKRAGDGPGLTSVFNNDDIYNQGNQGAFNTTAGGLNRGSLGSRNKGHKEDRGSYHKAGKEYQVQNAKYQNHMMLEQQKKIDSEFMGLSKGENHTYSNSNQFK